MVRTPRSRMRRCTCATASVGSGGIFGAIGLWPAIIRGGNVRAWMVGLAVVLILPALVAPRTLAPAQRAWMALGSAELAQRRPDRARQDWSRSLQLSPESPDAPSLRAALARLEGARRE